MTKKFPKTSWMLLSLLFLAPSSLLALKFTMPRDVDEAEQTSENAVDKDYGDSKYPLGEFGDPVEKDPEAVLTDEELMVTETVDKKETEESDFIEIPLLVAESEQELELEVEEVLAEGEGRIVGQVFDKETGAPVRGVAIAIEGTDMGTITDESGNFKLNAVPEGAYTLAYFKTGYLEAKITDVAITSGEIKELDFALPPRPAELSDDVYDLGTVTVTAEQANDMMALIDLKQTSVGSVDFLSAEDMARFGGGDIAGLVNRISGVNVVEGKFAVVRGLGDRYNSTLVNSLPVPSPDPVRQGVQLDLFSASIIENVIAEKTFIPSLPSNSSGAAFNLQTRAYPEEFTAWIETGFSINDNAQDVLLRNGNVEPFSGTPGGNEFDLKALFGRNDAFPSGDEFVPILDQVDNFGGNSFKAGFGDTFGMPWGGNLGIVTSLSRNTSSKTTKGVQQDRFAVENFISPFPFLPSSPGSAFIGELPASALRYDFTQSTVSENSSFLTGIGLDLDAEGMHSVDLVYLRSKSNISEASRRENGFLPEGFTDRGFGQDVAGTRVLVASSEIVGRGNSDLLTQGQDILSFEERTLEVKQISGQNNIEIFDRNLTFSWGASLNNSSSEIGNPDLKNFDSTNPALPKNFVGGQTSLFYLQNVSGGTLSGALDAVVLPDPVPAEGYLFGGDAVISDGFTEDVIRNTARTIDDEHDGFRIDFGFELLDALTIQTGAYYEELNREVEQLDFILSLNGENIASGGTLPEFVDDISSLSSATVADFFLGSSATVNREINDQYLQLNADFFSNLTITTGLRASSVKMSASGEGVLLPGFPLTGSSSSLTQSLVPGTTNLTNGDLLGFGSPDNPVISGDIDEQYILPALSMKYNFNDNWTFRIDYAETYALPSARELSPVFTVDTFTGDRVVGNPTLQPSDVQNFGSRLEWMSSDGISKVGFSVFYKIIETPIEQIGLQQFDTGINVQSFINNDNDADVLGFEFEGRFGLGAIDELFGFIKTGFWKYFSIGGNAAYIDAKVEYPEVVRLSYFNANRNTSIWADAEGNINIPSERRLYDQPEWTLNTDITFDNPNWGTRLTVSIYAQSDVLSVVGTGSNLSVDQFTAPYEQLDLNFSQTFLNGWEFQFNVSNLLDGERGIIYSPDDIDNDVERFSFKVGRTYSASLSYTF